MGKTSGRRGWVEAAFGAMVADGCFCIAFTVHLVNSSLAGGEVTLGDYLAMGSIVGVMVAACWVIYCDYWHGQSPGDGSGVKRMRIKELKEGAAIEFDGNSYVVGSINRSRGQIEVSRVGQPGMIIVEFEGKGCRG